MKTIKTLAMGEGDCNLVWFDDTESETYVHGNLSIMDLSYFYQNANEYLSHPDRCPIKFADMVGNKYMSNTILIERSVL